MHLIIRLEACVGIWLAGKITKSDIMACELRLMFDHTDGFTGHSIADIWHLLIPAYAFANPQAPGDLRSHRLLFSLHNTHDKEDYDSST